MPKWKEYNLDEIYQFSSGLSKPADQFGFGFPFLSFKEVFQNYFLPRQLTQLVNSTENERKSGSIKRGDVFITRTSETDDDLGMTSVALKDYPDATFNGFTKRMRPNGTAEILPEFAGYYFRAKRFQAEIAGMSSVTTRASLNNGMLAALKMKLPPFPEQKAIAEVLRSLDDKIDLLHRQNKTLESLAQTLFRQWFIEEADASWEEINLFEIADHVKDSVNPAKEPTKIFRHYSLPAFDEGMEPKLEVGKSILSNKYKVFQNTILISKLNPKTPRVWPIFGTIDEDSCICSTEFQVVKPKNLSDYGFIYYFLKSHHVTHELAGAAGGTSGSHQRVNPDDIFNLSLFLPPENKITTFDGICREHFSKIKANKFQIGSLTRLRDSLLPKLMSGEVTV